PRAVPRRRPAAGEVAPGRPRFTGRAAVLVLVLALLMVSYASSMRAYLEQRRHIADLNASIASSQAEVDRLKREKSRWDDPAFVRAKAHERFGWVMPGEVGFQVLEQDGTPMDHEDSLSSPEAVAEASRPLWWQAAWGSVEVAGRPRSTEPGRQHPATRIQAPKASGSTSGSASGQAR
ncbi:MAG: septum formation initiator family protein, partial [Nocardioidaceae bacterium]